MPLYNYDQMFKNLERRIKNSDIRHTNKATIFDFRNRLFAEGLSTPRVHKYTREIFALAGMTGCLLTKMEKKDVVDLVAKIEQSNWAPASKQGYKITIKKFYNVMELPAEHINWINTTLKKKHVKLPSDMLTEEDIMKMIEVNVNPRNRAMIAAFWDSGGRVGEVANWRVGYISKFKYGLKVRASGKTGSRQIPLIVAAPYITQWLAVHPNGENPTAPMWPGHNPSENMTYPGIYRVLRESAKKAGINKKFNPQTYRHSRATHLANHLTESQMDEYLGWVQGSNMPSIYVHLSGKNIDDAALKAAGVQIEEDKTELHKMKPKNCPRCHQSVGATFKLCPYCGLSLSIESVMSEEEGDMRSEEAMALVLAKYPELMDVFRHLVSGKK